MNLYTPKYELVKEDFKEFNGKTLYRIRALRDFGGVKAGDLGGYIEKEYNLSHSGNCWVLIHACVYDYARVLGNAQVYGMARVFGHARVYDYAQVGGKAKVSGRARVFGYERVFVVRKS